MTYLIGEILIYLFVAAVLGLAVGYLLWERRAADAESTAQTVTSALQERTSLLGMAKQDLAVAVDERDRLRSYARSLTVDAERSAKEVETLRGRTSLLQPIADRVPNLRASIEKLEALPAVVEALEDELTTSRATVASLEARLAQALAR